MLKMTFVEKTLGIFLVTFSTPEDAHKVLEDHTLRRRGNGILMTKNPGTSEYSSLLNPKDWKVKFAPPAADIYWYLTLTFRKKYANKLVYFCSVQLFET